MLSNPLFSVLSYHWGITPSEIDLDNILYRGFIEDSVFYFYNWSLVFSDFALSFRFSVSTHFQLPSLANSWYFSFICFHLTPLPQLWFLGAVGCLCGAWSPTQLPFSLVLTTLLVCWFILFFWTANVCEVTLSNVLASFFTPHLLRLSFFRDIRCGSPGWRNLFNEVCSWDI